MRSAVFYGKHNLKIKDLKIPKVKDNDVLIKVKACGVCGTDVHIYEGEKGAAEVTKPTNLGHEFSGVVEQIGKNVTNCKIGDRVSIDPNCYCGACDACRNGVAHFCENMIGYGTTINGGFAQYCSVNERQVYKLGDNTSFEQGAMAEPVACCLHGIDMCNIKPGHQVVIIGGGMIGLIMIQLVKLAGASKIALLEPVKSKRKIGKKMGADICIDPIKENVEDILKQNGMTWINTVIECVGKKSTIQQAIFLAGKKSTVMMFGLTGIDETVEIKPYEIFKKELEIKASYINPYTQKRALDLIDSGRIDVKSMICEVCSLDKLEEILKDPKLRAKGKYIIDPSL